MQQSFCIILLPLFLCLLLSIIFVSHCYSDTGNSVLSASVTVDSVVAPKMRSIRIKRLLQDFHDENHDTQRQVQETSNNQNLAGGISEAGTTMTEARTAISGGDEEHQIHPRSRRRP
ncbi:hypothetical protein ABKV19_014170 [Rosa sericea]